MGVEIPMEQVPVVQKHMIKRCNAVGKPVITATQMLETMISNPRPTRAEVSDVANAVYDRTSCIMLSGECAMGKYPVECVQTMVKISNTIEGSVNYWKRFIQKGSEVEKSVDMVKNIAYATCAMAEHIDADVIVAYTHTGNSARKLAGMGPGCPVIAITDDEKTFNKLSVVWNVLPILVEGENTQDTAIEKGIEMLKADGILEAGDVVVLSGGTKDCINQQHERKAIGGVLTI